MIKPPIIRQFFPFLLIVFFGCAQPAAEDPLAISDPLNKLIRVCYEENNLDVTVTPFDHTVWIYLPLEENFLETKATSRGPLNSDQPSISPSIKFLNGRFADGQFFLKADIAPSKGYPKDYGYTSQFSEQFKTAQRQILSAISRVYSPLSETPDKDDVPEFFVLVIADITNGLETKTLLNFEDLKRAHIDQSFHGEYAKRVISEQPLGNAKIIGDKKGNYIDYKDITWPEFLVKQMVFRVNFKYQRSSFPPSNDTRMELLTIAADTVTAYNFTDFTSVELEDLNAQTTFSTSQEDLTAYISEQSQGRLIHIKFQ